MDRRRLIFVWLLWMALAAAPGLVNEAAAQPAGYDRATLTVMRWDPSTPERIYAGTQGWGLVVSEDAGRSWSATAPQLGGRWVQSIAVHPLLTNVVVVGTLRAGIWRSVDGGKSFARIRDDLPEVDVPGVSLAVRLSEEDDARRRVYEERMRFSGRTPDPSKLSSTGEQALWVALRIGGPMRTGWPSLPERTLPIARMQPFHDISAHLMRPQDVLVAGRGQVARTVDGGETWERVFSPADRQFRESPHLHRDAGSCQGVPYRLEQTLSNPETVWLAACYGLFVTHDGGSTWSVAPLGGSGYGRVHAVAADPVDPSFLTASTDGGILRSRDAGLNWEFVRAASAGAPITALAALPGGYLVAGGYGGEIVLAHPDGEVEVDRLRELQATQTPQEEAERRARRSRSPYDRSGLAARPEANPRLHPGIDLHVADLVFHPNLSNVVFAGTRRGVFRSEDGGATWQHSSLGLGEMEVADLLVDRSAALLEPKGPDPAGKLVMLWAATRGGGIYRSRSSGRAWEPVGAPSDAVVRVLFQDSHQPHLLWVGTADGGVYRSSDAGETWHAASDGLEETGIRVLAQSEGLLLAGTDRGEIYVSGDDGGSWEKRAVLARQAADERRDLNLFQQLGLDPEAMHLHDLLADPDDSDRLVAAGSFGVFLTEDGGTTWEWTKLRRGVERLARDPFDEDKIYAATTRGLWWTDDGGETWRQAVFGEALNDLGMRQDSDPTQAVREVPPLFGVAVTAGGDVVAGTDRGQTVRGSPEFGGWKVSHLMQPTFVARPRGSVAPRKPPERLPPAGSARYNALRARRDQLIVASALAPGDVRRVSRPRHRALLALEARRRGEIPDYPAEVYETASLELRAELDKEDPATRMLRLANADIRSLKGQLVDGWGVDDVYFGPLGRNLAVLSSVDDGRRSHTELRLYDLGRRYLQPDDVHRRQGATQHWKLLHDLARKPQAAQPDWLLQDTGPLLLWRRGEILVTRPRDDRVAIWRLPQRSLDPAAATEVRPGTLRGFPLPVAAVSVSEDGKWLGAVDVAGRPYFVSLTGDREPHLVPVPSPNGEEEPPTFQQAHATSRQLLLLGPSGIVAYRWSADGPILETEDGDDAGEWLHGRSAGFSALVADRRGEWLAAVPAPSEDEAQTLLAIAFRNGLVATVHELATGSQESWSAMASAEQDWLAVRRVSRDRSESLLFGMRGDLTESPPLLTFLVRDAAKLRFGAGGEHVTFIADGEVQVWSLKGPAPRRVEDDKPPNLDLLAYTFQQASPLGVAAYFFEDDPRMADVGEWQPWEKHRTRVITSPDGRWLAVAGPGRLVRLWHFDDPRGHLADATGHLVLDLARFRPYPSTFPSSLDVWPEILRPDGESSSAALWSQACSIAGRNFSEEEWEVLFGEEEWQPTCSF